MRFIIALVLCVLAARALPADAQSPAIRYVYDDLNRLVGVVDQRGNASSYTYDPVGNILRIDRFAAVVQPPSSLAADPPAAEAKSTVSVALTGADVGLTTKVTTDNPGIVVYVVGRSGTEVQTTFVIAEDAALGPTTVRVDTIYGSATTTFTVLQRQPVLTSLTPAEGGEGQRVVIAGSGLRAAVPTTITFAGVAGRRTATLVEPAAFDRLVVDVPPGAITGDVIATVGSLASNGLPFTITGPSLEGLDGLLARAATGTPADAGLASTNGDQVTVVRGTGLVNGMALRVPIAQGGVFRLNTDLALTGVSADGTRAQATVPKSTSSGGLVTGQVRVVNNATGVVSTPVVLQAVPTLTSVTGGAITGGATMTVNGSTFTADMVVRFPLAGGGTAERVVTAGTVHFFGTRADVVVPDGVTRGAITVRTPGGESAAFTLNFPVFDRLENLDGTFAHALSGTPADPTQPSTNADQDFVVRGAGLTGATVLMVPLSNGGMQGVGLTNVSADGTTARVRINGAYPGPNFTTLAAVTGQIWLVDTTTGFESRRFLLQRVPVLTRASRNGAFAPGAELTLSGSAFTSTMTARFPLEAGGTVLQPTTSGGTRVTVPSGVGRGPLSVATNAGESAAIALNWPAFDRLENLDGTLARAVSGTPADPTQPSTNADQDFVVRGAGLTGAMILLVPLSNGGMQGVGLTSVSADGTNARVRINGSYPGPNFTTLQVVTGQIWLLDPATGFESVQRFLLQRVPVLTRASANGPFAPGLQLTLSGSAFTSTMTARFPLEAGGTVLQPTTSGGTRVTVPFGVGRGPLSVATNAGESAAIALNWPAFDRLENLDGTLAHAATGTPPDPTQPSTNGNHTVVVRGAGLTGGMVLMVPLSNGSRQGVTLTSVSADGTRAEAFIARSYPGPNFTSLQIVTGQIWILNPATGFESAQRFLLQVL